MLNRPSIAVNKWAVVLIGALLAIFVLSNPAQNGIFAHPHDPTQDDHDHIDIYYPENRTVEVRDFNLADPEGSAIEWNVRGVDAADFDISSTGVLTFVNSPDYENPTDRGLNLNPGALGNGGDDDFDDAGEFSPIDNEYQIMVSVTEVWDGDNASLPAKRTDIAVTVRVENTDDPGELTLQWLQPEVNTEIDATLADQDGNITDPKWTWYTSKVVGPVVGDLSNWNVVAAQTDESYTPVAVDEGRYLWVNVEYTDPQDDTMTRTANVKSMNPVRAQVSSGANASPDFEDDTDTRTMPESTAVGDPVGLPVTATDTDKDTLTYELDNDTDSTTALVAASDLQFFDIDMETGQIEVAKELDYDAKGEGRADDAVAGTYTVIVRATDPSGLADYITVTIMAENVNEDPIVTGRAELSVAEGTDDGYTALPDAPGIGAPPNPTNQQNEYVYEDPDHLDSIARWDLEGDDAGAFDHSGRFEPRYLQFKVAPDYENPTDVNKDNVYEVTLVATDTDPLGTGAGIGRVNVWLIVTNVEEAGKVVFTEGETAFLNEMLVAEVQDPDDHGGDLGEPYQGVHIVNWQWSRALTDADGTTFDPIDDATTNRYTPKDSDRGYYLRATARYTDPLRTEDVPSTLADERIGEASLRTEMVTTKNAVKVAPGLESAPTFPEAGTVTREVAENTAPGGNVGAPVAATGATLTYTLEGSDAEHFGIGSTDGQIKVGTDTSFDYEDPSILNTYRVTVKVEVTGGDANQKAEVDVNIIVTDVNEPPVITTEGEFAVDYPEIDGGAPNTAAVETYVGTDPEGATISWDLRGADAALFTIAGGVLQFRAAPDYENPKDVVGTNTVTATSTAVNNIYDIVIRAIASRASGDTGPAETVDRTVAVTVTDVDEDGEVVISWLQPEVGIEITASLADADGPGPVGAVDSPSGVPNTTAIADATWTWEVSEVVQGALDIENDNHWGDAPGTTDNQNSYTYTPAGADLDDVPTDNDDEIDEGKYLRVTASYTDRHGATKTAREMSAYPVQARGLGAKNQSPDFEGDKVGLSVAETAEVGDEVPGPVVATVVAPSATDILTYGLRAFGADDVGSTGVAVPSVPEADVAAFDIDKATGQITVAQKLDFEDRGTPNDGKYVVVATVTDPSGLDDSIVVVITAEDMNEDPVLSGRPELTINEIDSSEADADNPDFVGDPGAEVNVYNVVDEDRRAATEEWRLEGDDAGEFQLIGNVGRTLVFRNQPDYENPADANGDNVYKVTVVTFDGDGGRGEFDVCIAVMNINEDGRITLLDEDGNELVQPRSQGPITADLTDPDGGVTDVVWVWSRAQLDPPGTGLDGRSPITPAATSATYTPSNDDTSYFLHVMATYMDAKNEDPGDTANRTAEVTAAHAVLEVEDLKLAPAFPEDTAEVQVAENSPSTTYVGEAIVPAVDPEGATLTYTLEGDDAAHFELVPNTRQIRVKAPVAVTVDGDTTYPTVDLNREDDEKNSYEVVLKASDGALDGTITVTITVTDRNEAPMYGVVVLLLSIEGDRSVDYAEDSMDVVATYEARGTEADNATWSLSGADAGDFRINNVGELTFATKPDYEAPADADTDNGYEVTVVATAEIATQEAAVTVTVTNVDETGSVILTSDQAVVGVALVAALSDPDYVVIGSEVWQWARENDDGSYEDIGGATSESYTPVDDDNGRHLRVTVTYDDQEGSSGRSLQVTFDDLVTTMRTAGVYDVNNDGMIDKEEARAALTDYFDEAITKEEARAVITLYFMTSS